MTASSMRYIKRLLAYRDRSPTIRRIFRDNLQVYLALTVTFAALTAFFALLCGRTGALMSATAFVAVLLRDVGHVRRSIAMWPTTAEIVDWPKVENMAATIVAQPSK